MWHAWSERKGRKAITELKHQNTSLKARCNGVTHSHTKTFSWLFSLGTSVWVSVSLSVCLSVYVSVCLSVCLSLQLTALQALIFFLQTCFLCSLLKFGEKKNEWLQLSQLKRQSWPL